MSSDGGGWLTTKKSAEQIERDRKAALERRRLQRGGLQQQPQSKKPSSSSKEKPKKKKKKKGFIVDSSDDDDEEGEWNDDDGSEEELTDPGGILQDNDESSSSSSSNDSDVSSPKNKSYFGTHRKRTSKPPPKVQSFSNRFRTGTNGKQKRNRKTNTNTNNRKAAIELLPSSSSDQDSDCAAVMAPAKKNNKNPESRKGNDKVSASSKSSSKRKSIDLLSLSSSDDSSSDKLLQPPTTTKTNKTTSATGKKPPAKRPRKINNSHINLSSSSEDEALLCSNYFAKAAPSKVLSPLAQKKTPPSSVDGLIDTPCKGTTTTKKKTAKRLKKTISTKLTVDVDCSDDDEAIAIAAAMEESLRDNNNNNNNNPEEEENQVLDLVDSDDGDEQGNDVEQDDYVGVDENAQAASAVLETANQLSAHILQTMAKWSNSAVNGMIVDGSLAVAASKNGGTDPQWISDETMRSILPPAITLAEYQLIGVNWLALLHGMKCEVDGTKMANVNGILADEMGLGKTCQTIAFLSWLKHKSAESNDGQHLPHLVVAPASVVSNWKREFETFAPQLNVVKYHGSQKERREMQENIRNLERSSELDVVLAPITYFQKETSDDRSFLRRIKFDYLIVDEGHLLKNARGIRYKSMDRFSTLHRLLLTGTPVQNSPKELMSLLSFLMPLFSSPDDTGEDTNDGAESMLQHFVSLEHNDERAAYTKLKQLFSPFVLRRRKEDVLSQILPPKERQVELVEINSSARRIYDSVIERHLQAKKTGGSAAKEHLFTQLRKAAHHPLMLRARYTTKEEKEHLTEHFFKFGAFQGDACTKKRVAEELENFSDFEIHLTASELVEVNQHRRTHLDRYILREDDLFASAKFTRLRKLLPEKIANKHRVLIFSQWTTCLDLLGCLLEYMQIKYLRMDGSTQVSERQSLIDEFNGDSSISVFLLSTKACGQGINLTSADTCIMHDLDFNPFNDLQAEDRCHRIGQKKPVTIVKMVSKDTVDEEIYQMQQRKAKMNAAIMGNEADWKKSLQREKEIVLRNVVDRFLKSPNKPEPTELKENSVEGKNARKKCESI